MKHPLLILTLGTAAALSACGGGGDDDTPAPTNDAPPSASTSSAGLIAYVKSLVASPSDTLEPVNVSAVEPKTDDTAEPADVD